MEVELQIDIALWLTVQGYDVPVIYKWRFAMVNYLYDGKTLLIQSGDKLEDFQIPPAYQHQSEYAVATYIKAMVHMYRQNTGQWEKWQANIDHTSREEFLLAESYHYKFKRLGIYSR